MRPKKVEEEKLLSGISEVFRSKGYDGASLNELAEASGLKKASLYHRYPSGKSEIARAVLDFLGNGIHDHIYMVLTNQSLPPNERMDQVLNNINEFYNNGDATCILRSMTLDAGIELFEKEIQKAINLWLSAFEKFGIELGFTEEDASDKAKKLLVLIQGSLVVGKAIKDFSIFKDSLETIRRMYIE